MVTGHVWQIFILFQELIMTAFIVFSTRAKNLKVCVCYFLRKFYSSPNDSLPKTKLFLFSRYSNFVFPPSPLFLLVSHCLRTWSKINLKVYQIINCLNKNLISGKEEEKIQKFEYLENEKSFLDEIKNIFQSLKDYHLVKN